MFLIKCFLLGIIIGIAMNIIYHIPSMANIKEIAKAIVEEKWNVK